MSDFLIVIPARYGSTRLPGKALKLLAGKPVVQYVYEACQKANIGEVLIATENQIVVDAAAQFGAKAVLTSDTCQSGTDRVYEAAQGRTEKFIINVQGDEPFLKPDTLKKIATLLQQDESCDIASAVAPMLDEEKINNPNCVKAVLNQDGKLRKRIKIFPIGNIAAFTATAAKRCSVLSACPPARWKNWRSWSSYARWKTA